MSQKKLKALQDRENRLQKRINETSQDYKAWKEQYEKEKKIHNANIMQKEKEAEIQQTKLRKEQDSKFEKEVHKFKEEAQDGITLDRFRESAKLF